MKRKIEIMEILNKAELPTERRPVEVDIWENEAAFDYSEDTLKNRGIIHKHFFHFHEYRRTKFFGKREELFLSHMLKFAQECDFPFCIDKVAIREAPPHLRMGEYIETGRLWVENIEYRDQFTKALNYAVDRALQRKRKSEFKADRFDFFMKSLGREPNYDFKIGDKVVLIRADSVSVDPAFDYGFAAGQSGTIFDNIEDSRVLVRFHNGIIAWVRLADLEKVEEWPI